MYDSGEFSPLRRPYLLFDAGSTTGMACPRCGSELERYTLNDRSSVTCSSCGYVGVPVDHHGEPQLAETWTEAISRVPDASRIESVTVETAADDPTLELVFETTDDDQPEPTVVRVEDPDPALRAALEAAEASGDESQFVCDICGRVFDSEAQLYGHLSVHSDAKAGES